MEVIPSSDISIECKYYTDENVLISKSTIPILKYKLHSKTTIPPTKNNSSDAGYDLHLMELKEIKNGVYFYDTQVSIQLPKGFYGTLVGRSSISKSGYMLANNIGIIDNGYTGNICVALIKINKDAPDLTLPIKLVQLIPTRQYDFKLQEITELTETERGDKGGLGSGQFKK